MAQPDTSTDDRSWQQIFDSGDEEGFRRLAEGHTETLLAAARKALRFYLRQGHLHPGDLTPEEVAGEALVQAWAHRTRRPEKMGLRAWLLATEYRVLRGLVERQKTYRRDKAVSLDAPIPTDPSHRAGDDVQEWFYEWYQPDAVLTWEDVTPAQRPVDYEVPLDNDDLSTAGADAFHVLMMHDEFEMDLPEVAFTMSRGVEETGELLDRARASFRQHVGNPPPIETADHPTPLGQ